MYCPKCHVHVDDDAKFCSQCGQDLSAPYIEPEPEEVIPEPESRTPYVHVPAPSTDIEKMLDMPSILDDVATFRFPGSDAKHIASQMRLPTFATDGHPINLIVVNGIYRYRLIVVQQFVVLYVQLAQSAMALLEAREYFAAVAALKAVMPERYHEYIDPEQQGGLLQRLEIAGMRDQSVARFEFRYVTLEEMIAALGLPTYQLTTSISSPTPAVAVHGVYRYFMAERIGDLVIDILVASSAMSSLEAQEYHVATATLLSLLPEEYHEHVGPINEKVRASLARKQLPSSTTSRKRKA